MRAFPSIALLAAALLTGCDPEQAPPGAPHRQGVGLRERDSDADAAEIRTLLRRDPGPHTEEALGRLLAACKGGRLRIADFVPELVRFRVEPPDSAPKHLLALWREADAAALHSLAAQVENERAPIYMIVSVLRRLDSAEGWHAFLRGSPPETVAAWYAVLETGKQEVSLSWKPNQDAARREALRPDYHGAILRCLDARTPAVFMLGAEYAGEEKLKEAVPKLRARFDPLLLTGTDYPKLSGIISSLDPPMPPAARPVAPELQESMEALGRKDALAPAELSRHVLRVLEQSESRQPLQTALDKALDHGIEVPEPLFRRLLERPVTLGLLRERQARLSPGAAQAVSYALLKSGSLREDEAASILVGLSQRKDPDLPPVLLRLLGSHSHELRRIALKSLIHHFDGYLSQEVFLGLVSEGMLGGHDKAALADLAHRMDSPSLRAGLKALARPRAPGGRPNYLALLLLDGWGKIEDETLLEPAYPDTLDDVDKVATELIQRQRPRGYATYLAALIDASVDAFDWKRRVEALADVDAGAAAPFIVRGLGSPDEYRRDMAVELAHKHDVRKAIPALQERFEREKDPGRRERVMAAIAEMASPELEPYFLRYAADPDVGQHAVRALLTLNPDKHRNTILGLLKADGEGPEVAMKEIGDRGMKDAAPFVLAFLKAHTLGGNALTDWKNTDLGPHGRGRAGSGPQEFPGGDDFVLVKTRPLFHPLKAAIDTLESLRHVQAVPTLLTIARLNLQSLRMEAIKALIVLDPEGTRAELTALIAGSEWQATELLKAAILANPEAGHRVAFELLRTAEGGLRNKVERLLSFAPCRLRGARELATYLSRPEIGSQTRLALAPRLETANPPLPPDEIAEVVRAEPNERFFVALLSRLRSDEIAHAHKDRLLEIYRSIDPSRAKDVWRELDFKEEVIGELARVKDEEVYRVLEEHTAKSANVTAWIGLARNVPERFATLIERDRDRVAALYHFNSAADKALKSGSRRVIDVLAATKLPAESPEHSCAGLALVRAAELKLEDYKARMEPLLVSNIPGHRSIGRRMLLHYDPNRLFVMLKKAATDLPHAMSRYEFFGLLSKLGTTDAASLILEYQDDSQVDETRWLIGVLAEMRDPRGADLALRRMRERPRSGNDLDHIVPALLKIDGRKHFPVVRRFLFPYASLDLIAETCGPEAIPEIRKWMQRRGPDERLRAEETIEKLRRK